MHVAKDMQLWAQAHHSVKEFATSGRGIRIGMFVTFQKFFIPTMGRNISHGFLGSTAGSFS
jgi:hypothetical protein